MGMKFVHCKVNNSTETVYCSLLLRMARMEIDRILKNLAPIFKAPIFKEKPKMYHGYLIFQTID